MSFKMSVLFLFSPETHGSSAGLDACQHFPLLCFVVCFFLVLLVGCRVIGYFIVILIISLATEIEIFIIQEN